jgi:hypothetical protein
VIAALLLRRSIAAPATPLPPPAPFEARYEVWLDGKHRGESRIRLQTADDEHWEYRVDVEGRGLVRIAAATLQQIDRIDWDGGQPRLLGSVNRSDVLLRHREQRMELDWATASVRWFGDVDSDEAGPLALRPGASSAALLNLRLALDVPRAAPGERLEYPVYERGRLRQQVYRVDEAEQIVEVPAGRFNARSAVHERPDRQRVTTVWVAAEVPSTPVRLLQTEKGRAKYELRLIEAGTGAPARR